MKPVIFYIDDQAMNLTVFEAAMPDEWEIYVFDTAAEALQQLVDKQPWVVVSDQRMSQMNGVAFLEQVKTLAPEAVRIIVTAYSDEELVVESVRKAHIFDYIRKPWDPDALVVSLQQALNYYQVNHERHQLLVQLQATQHELARMAAFAEQSPSIMMAVDAHGVIGYLNPYARAFVAALAGEVTRITDFLPSALWYSVVAGLVREEPMVNYETSCQGRVYLWSFVPLPQQAMVHCYAVDITDKKAAEQRALSAEIERQAAERANQQKSAFLANMSHELRTPLNAIIGYSEMMIEDMGAAPDQAGEGAGGNEAERLHDLRSITTAANHLLRLINDILDISKLDVTHLDINVEEVDLHEVVAEVVSLSASLVRANGNVLRQEIGTEPLLLLSDHTRIKQILINLVGNACKFTRNGTVILRAIQESDQIKVEVSDTGIGIAPHELTEIFKPFVRSADATAKTIGGTGLGLSISKRLARLMGGDISVRSTHGEGSTFSLLLPRIDSEQVTLLRDRAES